MEGNIPLLYIVGFNDSRFDNSTTTNTSYLLANISQEEVLEITITPTLHFPFLDQTGPPLSSTVSLGKLYELLHVQLHISYLHKVHGTCVLYFLK